ncbi:MAG: hypothetical protein RLZZ117_305 [Cyanobacteriota bacterium]|jgi:hypothetical protein
MVPSSARPAHQGSSLRTRLARAPVGLRMKPAPGMESPRWRRTRLASRPVCTASVLGRRERNRSVAAGGWRRWGRGLLHLALVALLACALSACTGPSAPPRATLLNALALQIQLTQADVARALDLASVGTPLVSRVRVEEQRPVTIGENAGLRLRGRFDWRLDRDPFRVDAPFEIFLERGARGESWRLARPAGPAPGGGQDWLTYPLPLRGDSAVGRTIPQDSPALAEG